MLPDDIKKAISIIEYDYDANGRQILRDLRSEFYLIPKHVMQHNPPSLLRERAQWLEKDGRTWLAQWLRDMAEAMEE